MKKKVLLLFTLLISLIIYSGRVLAVQELTCLYLKEHEDRNEHSSFVLIQKKDGSYRVGYRDMLDKDNFDENSICDSLAGDESNWAWNDPIYTKISSSAYYDGNVFTACPKYMTYIDKKGYVPSNDDTIEVDGTVYNDLVELSWSKSIDYIAYCNGDLVVYDPDPDDPNSYEDPNPSEGWTHKCQYYDFDMYYSADKTEPYFEVRYERYKPLRWGNSMNDLLSRNGGNCPTVMYTCYSDAYESYMASLDKLDSSCHENKLLSVSDNSTETPSESSSCKELFGDELYDKFNQYYGIIKIIIPILLIGFGIFDFSKALLGNEENMKKARTTFILRIVIAVLFFLLPVILKLILSIANTVWSFINPDVCIK